MVMLYINEYKQSLIAPIMDVTDKEVTMAREIREFSTEEWLNLKKDSLHYADEECERRAWDALPPLLPRMATGKQAKSLEWSENEIVISQAVTEVCIQVTCRTARQRVRRWLTSHTSPALFAKEYETEVGKTVTSFEKSTEPKTKSVNEPNGLSSPQNPVLTSHKEDALSPAQIVIKIRDFIVDVKAGIVAEIELVYKMFDDVTYSIESRSDYTPPSLKAIFTLTVDLAIFLVAYGISEETQWLTWNKDWKKFIALWDKLSPHMEQPFSRLLSPRNLFLFYAKEQEHQLSQKKTSQRSLWPRRLSCLLSSLLSSKHLTSKQLEEQSLTVLHYSWSQEFLDRYSECIRGVQDHPMVKNVSVDDDDNTSGLLMEWLAESCATMEILD